MAGAISAPYLARRRPRFGAYSAQIWRGALSTLVDGRSAEGRFIRVLEQQLVEHLGGSPNVAQRLLIDRIIRLRLQMEVLDQKLTTGNWSDLDRRTYSALLNASRLHLRDLGIQPATRTADPLAGITEALASHRGEVGPASAVELRRATMPNGPYHNKPPRNGRIRRPTG
jgi:hypothetical protein